MGTKVQIVKENEGKTLAVAGGIYRVIISGKETNGNYAVIEMLVPPGGGPPPHSHPNIQEMFYVTEGELLYKTETGTELVKVGGFVNIPFGGAIHCFKNKSDSNARVLCTVVPAGLEEIFLEVGEPTQPGKFLPPIEMTPERLAYMKN
jgi:quercetin dioxygenase-like cupin family protein